MSLLDVWISLLDDWRSLLDTWRHYPGEPRDRGIDPPVRGK